LCQFFFFEDGFMRQRSPAALVAILILAAIAAWVGSDSPRPDWVRNLLFWRPAASHEIKIVQGLDLQGGLEVLLQADPAAGQTVSGDDIQAVRIIVEQRINGLGVSEPLVQQVGTNRIAVQLPGVQDPDLAIKTFGETGLLEFVDTGSQSLPEGTVVSTTAFIASSTSPTVTPSLTLTVAPTLSPTTPATPVAGPTITATPGVTATPAITASGDITAGQPVSGSAPITATEPVTAPVLGPFNTIMTGVHLQTASVGFDSQTNAPIIQFTLTQEGARIFADFTAKNVGNFLTITLDKRVISSPRINGAIPSGNGQITGSFTREQAQSLVVQLKYGALPVPLRVLSSRTVGPTLGQDSINKSLLAGIIGVSMVVTFMLLYYRLPGLLADVALVLYGLLVLSIFKLLPVTLTLAGIAGFVLSIGLAVDANILIFERMKEELRAGRSLKAAMRAGFERAWPSIRDSNASTLITCAILFWFGTTQGASIVAGFALTLAIGVLVSLFTAIVVTRNLLTLVMDLDIAKSHWWFGV
jgi:preprotein translocase subunit SecD